MGASYWCRTLRLARPQTQVVNTSATGSAQDEAIRGHFICIVAHQ